MVGEMLIQFYSKLNDATRNFYSEECTHLKLHLIMRFASRGPPKGNAHDTFAKVTRGPIRFGLGAAHGTA